MEVKEADLCIVGAGPVGIILALEYAQLNPNSSVILLEYGLPTTEKNTLDDSIDLEHANNHHDVYECTNKGFGGTSKTWGGRCVMYDEIDFISRPILEGGCTWSPDLYSEIHKYLDKASHYFLSGEGKFDLKDIKGLNYDSIAENFKEGAVTSTVIERWSLPTRFGDEYRKQLESTTNISLLEGYQVTHFKLQEDSNTVRELDANDLNGLNIKVKAGTFVITAGAVESTRLLLRNTQIFQKTLGYVPDSLGKYYQSHLSGKIASVKFYGDPGKTDYGFIKDKDGIYLRRRFQFSADLLVKRNLLNTAIWLDNPLYHKAEHGSGEMSLMYLAMITPFLGDKLAPPAIQNSVTKGKKQEIGKHIVNVLRGFPKSLTRTFSIFYKRYFIRRKLPGVFLYNPTNTYALHFHSEQIPLASNCIRLKKDGFSLEIKYDITDKDIESVIELHEELDRYLRDCNCGELVYWFPKKDLKDEVRKMSKDGIHQSGTTRIGNNSKEGVLDADLKVFGTNNLYVCSSSAFPTSSQANPTFMAGVFAVRLATYLSNS